MIWMTPPTWTGGSLVADQVITRETISITHQNVTEVDRELGAAFNRTAFKALQYAARVIEYGPDAARVPIVRSFLGAIAKLSVLESKDEIAASRETLMNAMTRMAALDPGVAEAVDAEIVE